MPIDSPHLPENRRSQAAARKVRRAQREQAKARQLEADVIDLNRRIVQYQGDHVPASILLAEIADDLADPDIVGAARALPNRREILARINARLEGA